MDEGIEMSEHVVDHLMREQAELNPIGVVESFVGAGRYWEGWGHAER